LFDHRCHALGADAGVGFVEGVNLDVDVVTEDVTLGAVLGQAVERGE
jgi:hypothetical protein